MVSVSFTSGSGPSGPWHAADRCLGKDGETWLVFFSSVGIVLFA